MALTPNSPEHSDPDAGASGDAAPAGVAPAADAPVAVDSADTPDDAWEPSLPLAIPTPVPAHASGSSGSRSASLTVPPPPPVSVLSRSQTMPVPPLSRSQAMPVPPVPTDLADEDDAELEVSELEDADLSEDLAEGEGADIEVEDAAPAEALDDAELIESSDVDEPEPSPIEHALSRFRDETWDQRVALYDQELRLEDNRARAALLEHEVGDELERWARDEGSAIKAYARSLTLDPMLRPNLWAVRRIFFRRKLWPSLLKLLEAEARYASSDRERAELWTEKGHVLEDCLGEVEQALICYKTAQQYDPRALPPLCALEKVYSAAKDDGELLKVHGALAAATQEPGRRVALLCDLARTEEARGGDLDRALSYLHDAYEVGVDQLRVVDMIIRMTSARERIPDCLAALDVKAELLEMQAAAAPQQRHRILIDEVVAVRRWQAALCRGPEKDLARAWQYLQAANGHSPGDPLILGDLIDLAEALGRWDDLEALLGLLGERYQDSRPDAAPPLGLWLQRASALRHSGRLAEADALEAEVQARTPDHLPLLLLRERRALENEEATALAGVIKEEADLARRGLTLRARGPGEDAAPQADLIWAQGALLRAAWALLRTGEYGPAREFLEQARALPKVPDHPQASAQEHLITEVLALCYERGGAWAPLAGLYEDLLREQPEGQRAARLHEALAEIYADRLDAPDLLASQRHNAALCRLYPQDLRLRVRAVDLARRSGSAAAEAEALLRLDELEGPAAPAARRVEGLLRRAELLAGAQKDEVAAISLYEEALRVRPGEARALEPLEELLRRAGRSADLYQLLRRQADACPGVALRTDAPEAQRLLVLLVKLAELCEQELSRPAEAASIYRDILIQRPGYLPVLQALCRLYGRTGEAPRLADALELLVEALPEDESRAEALLRLGEVYEDLLDRPAQADDTYRRVAQVARRTAHHSAHALLGRLRVLARQRDRSGQAAVLHELRGLVGEGAAAETLRKEAAWLLQSGPAEALGAFGLQTGEAGTIATSAEAAGTIATSATGKSETSAEAVPLAALSAWRDAVVAEDPAAQAAVLTELSSRPGPAAGLRLRAGALLGAAGPAQHVQARELLWRAVDDAVADPTPVVVLSDLLPGAAVADPRAASLLALRRALCPDDGPQAKDDQLSYLLAESESALAAAAGAPGDNPAAEAAQAALQVDPQSVPALLWLQRALFPGDDATPEALRAYAACTLRLAEVLVLPEHKAARYAEAAVVLRALGDRDGAAAALRAVLDHRPHDAMAFGQLYELLVVRAQPAEAGGQGDPGPLLEALDARLGVAAADPALRSAETPLKVALLLQRAALRQAAGQDGPAVADLRALLDLDPNHAVALRRLGELLAATGQPLQALECYERFLQLPQDPADRRDVMIQAAALLSEGDRDPAGASRHLQGAIQIVQRERESRAPGAAPDLQALQDEKDLYQWQVRLLLAQKAYPEAVAMLWQLGALLPPGPDHGIEQARVELEIADVMQHQAGDLRGALAALERALVADPLSLEALDRLVPLCHEMGETQRQTLFLSRAITEARRQAAQQRPEDLNGEPYHVLSQLFLWQGLPDAQNLALQAEAVVSGTEMPVRPPPRAPSRAVSAPLESRVYPLEAHGPLLDLWREVSDSAARILSPDLGELLVSPRERLNARGVPSVWAPVDQLVQRIGGTQTYGLYMSRTRDLCQLVGSNLVCGSQYAAAIEEIPPVQYYRLVRHLLLLPDRIGPVFSAPAEDLLMFLVACCRVAEVPAAELPGPLTARLEDRVRNLGKVMSRKEKKGVQALGASLGVLTSGSAQEAVAEWQQAVRIGTARLALALGGDLPAALTDLKVSLRDERPDSAALARALLLFSISSDIQEVRRELGLSGEEGRHGRD